MKILLNRPIVGWKELKGDFEISFATTREEVLKGITDAVGFIPLLSFKVDPEIIDRGKKLKVIANYAVGYDNIDVRYATGKGIYVLNTPDVLTRATAELTWALIFAVSRRLLEGDRMVREGRFSGWKPDLLLGLELKGRVLGVVGCGRIGSEVARIGVSLGLQVIVYDRVKKEGFVYRTLDRLLAEADIITLHLPLTEETRHLIDRKRLSLLKDGAILINTGRGALIDESALIEVLKRGRIRAGLDVYEREPLVPEELKSLNNVILLPHIGSATHHARYQMSRLCFEGIRAVLSGELPQNLVNPEVRSG